MLKRKIYKDLLEWKSRKHKCLVITGQRQVGKTYIVDLFGRSEYERYVYINLSDDEKARQAFQGNLDTETIVSKLSLIYGMDRFVPDSTLIFLDEIQDCLEAYSALKQFSIDGRFDVIASGSLLGVMISGLGPKTKSTRPLIPMGYEELIEMRSLDFEEFLWGMNTPEETIDKIRKSISQKLPIDDFMLSYFSDMFNKYTAIGGMPAAVQIYAETKNLSAVSEKQQYILARALFDINRYSDGTDKLRTAACFESIPNQLRNTNKKFMYSRIDGGGSRQSADRFMGNLQWIRYAGYINICHNLYSISFPLRGQRIEDSFRTFMSDTGLLVSMFGLPAMNAAITGDRSFNLGAISENAVMEALVKSGTTPYYFRKEKGKERMEIDFVTETMSGVTAIEVKSGIRRDCPSISKVGRFFKIHRRIMFADGNIFADDDGLEHYPLFASAFFKDIEDTEPLSVNPSYSDSAEKPERA